MSLDRNSLAAQLAVDIHDGWVVNLGIGLPTRVADHSQDVLEIILHTENGLLGPRPMSGDEDGDLINACKEPVTALAGASYFDTAESFGLMRGGHPDLCVLRAFQVSVRGDLASWSTGEPEAVPTAGGGMDLAIGARDVCVLTDLLTQTCRSKVVAECSCPVTGAGRTTRIYTDHAVFAVTRDGLDPFDVTLDELEELMGLPLQRSGAFR